MAELLIALLLGVVQGVTEFLPVSSSGHLLLGQYFLGVDGEAFGLSFDVALHVGTLVAVVWFFRRDLTRMGFALVRSLRVRNLSDPDGRLACLIVASTFPAALVGYLFEDFFASAIRSPWIVVSALVLVGVLFLVGESVGQKHREASKLTFREAVGVGVAQAAALVPGVSRSGATITLGLFLGLRREEAARFSFLMSVPIILGAGGSQFAELVEAGMDGRGALLFGVGMTSSAVVGYLAIRFFIGYVAHHSLKAFAYYRFALAAVVVVLLAFNVGG